MARHARSIRTAVNAINQAQQTLDVEVAAARATGMSWAEIGRAAGVTRQGARERWCKTLGDSSLRNDD